MMNVSPGQNNSPVSVWIRAYKLNIVEVILWLNNENFCRAWAFEIFILLMTNYECYESAWSWPSKL